MSHDYQRSLELYDSHRQYDVLRSYPSQAEQGAAAAAGVDFGVIDRARIRVVVIGGMGGSAIGGELIRTLALDHSPVPVIVNRSYSVPAFVDASTLFIAVTYSGGTEETLSALADARQRGAQTVVITSGESLRATCADDGIPCVLLPGGFAPRHAFGCLFFSLLGVCRAVGLLHLDEASLAEAADVLRGAATLYASFDAAENPAIRIAERLHGTLPVLYAHGDHHDCVLTRWRCQIEENAKMLAYANTFPELNHNEIVGWEQHPEMLRRIALVCLRERRESPRIARRIDFTLDLLRPYAGDVIKITAEEETQLGRLLGLICLGDWISYYLAIGTRQDPFPIQKIDALKTALARA
jgi:glucose/mannose-6-phosphate isomerase